MEPQRDRERHPQVDGRELIALRWTVILLGGMAMAVIAMLLAVSDLPIGSNQPQLS